MTVRGGGPRAGVFVAQEANGVRVATNPFQFIQQVRAETAKVVWPTRRETMITTIMVFIMCAFAAIFFFIVDRILGWGISLILG